MALTEQLMGSMDDTHLLAALEAELDPLTTTDAERVLVCRVERLLEEKAESAPLLAALADCLFSFDDLVKVLDILNDHYVDTPAILQQKLERADKFYDIASDAGDVISRLSDLINTTL